MIYKVRSSAIAAPIEFKKDSLTVQELKVLLPDVPWENSKISFITATNILAMREGTKGVKPSEVSVQENAFTFPEEDTSINISPVHMKQGLIELTVEDFKHITTDSVQEYKTALSVVNTPTMQDGQAFSAPKTANDRLDDDDVWPLADPEEYEKAEEAFLDDHGIW